jgi:SAM-dependent methyltransferase
VRRGSATCRRSSNTHYLPAKADIACPTCREPLTGSGCSSCRAEYPELRGIPVLIADADVAAIDLAAGAGPLPTYDSAQMGIRQVDEALASGQRVLELGAGLDVHEAPNLVKTDAFVYPGASLDFVADAHALPFADASFDFVFSLAVFEHLHSPWIAAREIARVLRPGGGVYTLAAFLQPLHGYPDHYFNATESGLGRLFANDFEVQFARPSRHCPDRQSIVPFDRMRDMAEALRTEASARWRSRVRAWRLSRALARAGYEFVQIAEQARASPAGFEAWRHIAPAVEVYAIRCAPPEEA